MRYKNSELQERLASEYALGTMTQLVRNRFERLMEEDADLNKLVCQWEQRLQPLSNNLQPENPGPQVWRAIDNKIKGAQLQSHAAPTGFWNNLLFLKGFSSIALAVIVGLSVMLQQLSVIPDSETPVETISRSASYVAVMLDSNNTPSMVINTYRNPLQLSVNLLKDISVSTGKRLHLWAITKETREIHSLGQLALDDYSIRSLSKAEWKFLKHSRELFITEESPDFNGSQPTGKQYYQGVCSVFKAKPVKL